MIKGKKFYAIMSNNATLVPIGLNTNIDVVKRQLDATYRTIVELEVTRVFEINPAIIEVEK